MNNLNISIDELTPERPATERELREMVNLPEVVCEMEFSGVKVYGGGYIILPLLFRMENLLGKEDVLMHSFKSQPIFLNGLAAYLVVVKTQ